MSGVFTEPSLDVKGGEGQLNLTSGGQDVTTSPTEEAVKNMIREESFRVKDSLATNSVTVLGIFASFIAFLTIEVQILKTVCDYSRILGFSMFILGAVLFFVAFIIYFTDSQAKNVYQKLGLVLSALLLVIGGIYFIQKGNDEYVCKLNRLDADFQKLQVKLQEDNEKWIIEKTNEFKILKKSIQEKNNTQSNN